MINDRTGHENNLANNYVPEFQFGGNAQVVGYAQRYDPHVSYHLSLAQNIEAKDGF